MNPFIASILSLALTVLSAHAGTVTRREFVKDGITYVEETNIGKNGNISKSVFPKPGRDPAKLEAEVKAAEAEPKAVPRSRRGGGATRGGAEGGRRGAGSITRGQAAELNQAIGSCKPFSLSAAHPMFAEFTIDYKVHGLEGGKCKFTQTMPGNEIQTCHFTSEQRGDIQKRGATALQKWMGDPKVCPITKG